MAQGQARLLLGFCVDAVCTGFTGLAALVLFLLPPLGFWVPPLISFSFLNKHYTEAAILVPVSRHTEPLQVTLEPVPDPAASSVPPLVKARTLVA